MLFWAIVLKATEWNIILNFSPWQPFWWPKKWAQSRPLSFAWNLSGTRPWFQRLFGYKWFLNEFRWISVSVSWFLHQLLLAGDSEFLFVWWFLFLFLFLFCFVCVCVCVCVVLTPLWRNRFSLKLSTKKKYLYYANLKNTGKTLLKGAIPCRSGLGN